MVGNRLAGLHCKYNFFASVLFYVVFSLLSETQLAKICKAIPGF